MGQGKNDLPNVKTARILLIRLLCLVSGEEGLGSKKLVSCASCLNLMTFVRRFFLDPRGQNYKRRPEEKDITLLFQLLGN